MGMIGSFKAVSDADVAAVLQRPKRIEMLLFGEYLKESSGGLLGLFKKKPAAQEPVDDWAPDSDVEEIDIDKTWHALHFLLADDPDAGDPPLNFILAGGATVGDIDVGYGPAHAFTAAEVKGIASALESITPDSLRAKFDGAALQQADIYPTVWDDPETVDYITEYFEDLKVYIGKAAQDGHGLFVWLA